MQLCLHHFHNFPCVFFIVGEVQMVYIDDEQFAVIVAVDPVFVAVVQSFEVIEADAALVIASAHLDVFYQSRDAGPQINEQIGGFDRRDDGLEERQVIVEVTALHEAHICQIGGENIGILVDGAILHDGSAALLYLLHLTVATGQKKNLQVERPALHVHVEIGQIRIAFRVFVMDFPAKMARQKFAKGGLTRPDVPRYGNVFDISVMHRNDWKCKEINYTGASCTLRPSSSDDRRI